MPQFPEKIWSIIAGHMSVRKWAIVRGINRATPQVQPAAIHAQPRSRAEVCWMVQNWHQAHTLDISFTQLKAPSIRMSYQQEESCVALQRLDFLRCVRS